MTKLLKNRNAVYGICAVWIILFHVFRKISMPYIPVVTNVVSLGNMAVDVFLVLSGMSLSLSAQKRGYEETGWKQYYQRRFNRVLIPYLIVAVPYYLWNCIAEHTGGIIRRIAIFVANLTSASFWLKGMQTTWYVYAIVVFYLLFPHIYRFVKNQKSAAKAALLILMALFAIATNYIPIVKNSMIVWSRLPVFTLGVIVGLSGREELPEMGMAGKVISSLFLIAAGWFISSCEIFEIFDLPQVYRLLLYMPMAWLIVRLQSQFNWGSRFWSWIGGMSLESYLLHITLLHPLKYYGIMDAVGNWLYLLLPMLTIALSCVVMRIEEFILSRLERKTA